MGKTLRFKLGMGIVLVGTGVWAVESGEAEPVRDARATVQKEELVDELTPVDDSEAALAWLPEGLEYGALFEMETAHSDGSTDTTMATIELGLGWQMVDWLRGDVVFLYEEHDTDPMELDQAFFVLGNLEEFPLYLQGGKYYVPFGNLESFFVSDPIVLELAEGREKGGTLGFEQNGFNASLTVFDSDVDGTDDYNGILAASYEMGGEDASVAFGAGLIYNILDADSLHDTLKDEGFRATDESAGANLWLTAAKGPITFIAEYVQVLESLEDGGRDTGLKPASVNLELGVALTDFFEIGTKYEYADDVEDWYAEQRFGVVGNLTVFERDWVAAGVSLEYLHEKYDGGDDEDWVTLQLGLEF